MHSIARKILWTSSLLLLLVAGSIVFFSYHIKPAHAVSWYNGSWPYRQAITINHSLVSNASGTTLTSFPVLVTIASDTNLASFASSTGADILFTDSDGVTKLNHEIESYSSSTGQLIAWVSIPSLSPSGDHTLYMYFGDASNTVPQQSATGTWDNNFVGVYHFATPTGTFSAYDSTTNGNTETPGLGGSDPSAVSGLFDGGASIPGSTNGFIGNTTGTVNIVGQVTIEAWVNENSFPINFGYATLISKGRLFQGSDGYSLGIANNGGASESVDAGMDVGGNDFEAKYNFATSTLGTGVWHDYVGTYDGSQWNVYVDGVSVASHATSSGAQADTADPLRIGVDGAGGGITSSDGLNGIMDEARISSVARSPDWINTEYNNESNLNTFESFSSLQTDAPPTISSFSANPGSSSSTVTSTLSWNVTGANTITIAPGGFSTTTAVGSVAVNVASTTVFTLSANNVNGTSTATTTVFLDTVAPSVPTNLVPAVASSSAINLSWTASTDNVAVTGYDIYRGTSTSSITKVATSSTNTYTDNGLASSTTYYYQVDAYDAVGNTSARSSIASGTTFVPGTTIVNVSSTVATAAAKEMGINIGGATYYDSGMIYKNLFADDGNPGFEPQTWESVIQCASVTTNTCVGSNVYELMPNGFWSGGTYEVIYGSAQGRSGSIVSSLTTGAGQSGTTTFTFASGSPAIGFGDWIIVRQSTPGLEAFPTANSGNLATPVIGWWTDPNSTSTFFGETSDIPSDEPAGGTQALEINSPTTTAHWIEYLDSASGQFGRKFIQLQGTYELSFDAKPISGSNILSFNLYRASLLASTTFALGGGWNHYAYTFAPNDSGAIGTIGATFSIASGTMLMDNVSLEQINSDPNNNTVFTDAMVNTLKALHPGIIRDWTGQLGTPLSAELSPQLGRTPSGYGSYGPSSISLGLDDFLHLSQAVGAEPWYVIPITWSVGDVQNMMQYLGGSASTTYGAIRAANGQVAPWTSVFPEMHFELGNEEWNGVFGDGSIQSAAAFGTRVGTIFSAIKNSPYYASNKFQLSLGTIDVNQSYTDGEAAAAGSTFNAINTAPYFANTINASETVSNAVLYGGIFGEIQYTIDNPNGASYKNEVEATNQGVPLTTYEENLSPTSGTISTSSLATFTPSLGVGIALGEQLLMNLRDLHVRDQNVFALPGYVGGCGTCYMWGTVVDMGGDTNKVRPTYLAEQLVDQAIGTGDPNMLVTTQSGINPTFSSSFIDVQGVATSTNANNIESFAFSNGNIILMNLSTTSSLPVILAGSHLPSGTVTESQLTSANITDNNESDLPTPIVAIATTTLANFNASQPITLPPFSMTLLASQGIGDITPPSTPTGLSASVVSQSEIDLSWTASTDNVGVAGYDVYRNGINIGSTNNTSYADMGLSAGTTYSYAVDAYDGARNTSGQSSSASGATQSPSSGGGGNGGGGGGGPSVGVASGYATSVAVTTTTASSSSTTTSTSTVSLEAVLASLEAQLQALEAQTNGTGASGSGSATIATPSLTRNLAPGSRGADVTLLQHLLTSDGDYKAGIFTAFYGSLTEAAVKAFQKKNQIIDHGTPATTGYGAVGPKTRKALDSL